MPTASGSRPSGLLRAARRVVVLARALGAFGGAWFDAGEAAVGAVRARVRAVLDVHRARRVALFAAGLAADPASHVRARSASAAPAPSIKRGRSPARSRSPCASTPRARPPSRGALELAPRAADQAFEEHTERALGAPLPALVAGVVPRVSPHDAAAFVGVLLAARDRRALVERFDEDWFRSPHAARALREEDAVALPPKVTRAAVDAGLTALDVEAQSLLG